jgi:hypothetical protein
MGEENINLTQKKTSTPKNGIEGYHYMLHNFEPYAGLRITAENKRQFLNSFKQDYVQANVEKVESGEMTSQELLYHAERYARDHVNFHKKMEKRHTKGDIFFRYKGRKERVVTTGVVTKLQQYLQDIEAKHIENQSKQEEE